MSAQCLVLSRTLCSDLDTPVALGVYLRQKYGEWDDYLAMRVDPRQYLDTSIGADLYFRDVQAVDFLRKFPDLPVKRDLEKEARDLFFVLERENAKTNIRLNRFIENYGLENDEEPLAAFFERVRGRIADTLGKLPQELTVRFGKGAVFESKGHPFGQSLTIADKMTMPVSLTQSAVCLSSEIFRTAWGRAVLGRPSNHVNIIRGSRFGTVSKDATKHRAINVEPGGNLSLQLAIGKVIRHRLKRKCKLDLNRGQDIHRHLAWVGSLSEGLATFDLSNASDLISYCLVKLLLPADWFLLLESVRSGYTLVDKKWVRLEKFSSMGNGYTFELETLIFHALVTEICDGQEVKCFGDDLIFPAQFSKEVGSALRYAGLQINIKKSFYEGPFRESCGGDFFAGLPVRPFYLDFNPKEPHEYLSLANGLRRASLQTGMGRHYFGRTWRRATSMLPVAIRRCVGPSHLGDLTLNTSGWAKSPQVKVRSCIRYVRVWRPVPKRIRLLDSRFTPQVQLATILYGSAEGGRLTTTINLSDGEYLSVTSRGEATLTPRGGVSGYRFGRVPYS